jgi:Ca2+-binding RTX toxin-like protein
MALATGKISYLLSSKDCGFKQKAQGLPQRSYLSLKNNSMNSKATVLGVDELIAEDAKLLGTLDLVTQLAYHTLTLRAVDKHFIEVITESFGDRFDAEAVENLQQQWANGDFSELPPVEILPAASLNGARGAFSSDTKTIYLSQDFIALNAGNLEAITSVLLEEIGHFIDSCINQSDTGGDEGEIFAALVQEQTLDTQQLQILKVEDDEIAITLGGTSITAEAATSAEDNLDLLTDQIDELLDTIKTTIAGQVFNNFPLLGNLPLASYIDQFITETLENKLIDELNEVEDKTATSVRQALFEALGSDGLGLLLDSNGDNSIDINDIQIPDSPDSIEYKLKIGKTFNPTLNLAENLGIPGLELKLQGGASAELDLSLGLHFGVDDSTGTDAFFIKTSAANELQATLGLKLEDADGNPLSFKGSLGFLELNATDNGSEFNSSFQADVTGTPDADGRVRLSNFDTLGAADTKLTANADLKLKLNTGLDDLGTDDTSDDINNGILPSIEANLNLLGLRYDSTTGTTISPSISFEEVKLDLGTFVKNFAGDVLDGIKKVSEPFQPITDTLTEPLPVIGNSLVGLAESLVPGTLGETAEFIGQLDVILDIINEIPTGDENFKLDLGDFSVSGGSVTQTDSQKPDTPIDDQIDSTTGDLKSFFDTLNEEGVEPDEKTGIGDDLQFPILDDPTNVIKLLLGAPNVELFTYETPKLSFQFPGLGVVFPPDPGIPIFGPITLQFFANAGASAQLLFGFDSKGLVDFKNGGFNDPSLIFDGFFASRPLGTDPLDPSDDEPNLTLFGEVGAKAGVNAGIVDIAVGGGIRLSTGLSLYNPTDPLEPFKVRGSDILSKSPLCLFETEGVLSAFIFAAFELDLGFFSITKRFNLADINLIDFETRTDCDDLASHFDVANPERDPELQAALAGQGIIDRTDKDGLNTITVVHKSGSKGDEEIDLIGLDPEPKKYENVKAVILDGKEGNDLIQFIGGVRAFGEVKGGTGDDTIITGDGYDFLNGGSGNDTLNGGGDKDSVSYADAPTGVVVNLALGVATNDGYGTTDTLISIQDVEGSRFNDRLTAHNAGSVLDAGAGNDELTGGLGNDVMLGGSGADLMDGKAGEDTTTYIGSTAPVYVNLSSQEIAITSPVDGVMVGLEANAGYGGDAEGDRIFNIENVHGSIYDDILVASDGGGKLAGYRGNDLVVAGAGADNLDGDSIEPDQDGVDWLSYSISNAGVNVSLATGGSTFSLFSSTALGGYAQGDKIEFTKDANGDPTSYSSFENLEGSNYNDTLEGDRQDNIIRGLSGNDSIFGREGNDTLIGGAGADTLNGGFNSGTLQANSDDLKAGGDTASYEDASTGVSVNLKDNVGERGDAEGDRFFGIENLLGSAYSDTLIGDDTDNDINPGFSNQGIDVVDGGDGTDRLTLNFSLNDDAEYAGVFGGFGFQYFIRDQSGDVTNDRTQYAPNHVFQDDIRFFKIERLYVIGTSKGDQIFGGLNRDILLTGAGDDIAFGGGGADRINADDGNDFVRGDGGDDSIDGGEGNDQLFGDSDNDTLIGGSGNDSLEGGVGNDRLFGQGNDDILIGDGGNDFLNGGDGNDQLFGGSNNDALIDGQGNDFLGSNDTLNGGNGNDLLNGGDGSDRLFGQGDNDILIGGQGNDFLDGGDGNDQLFGDSDILVGGQGNDFYNNDDTLEGGNGNDLLNGGVGRDQLFGQGDNDILIGGQGNDFLDGGDGNDQLFGDSNSDVLIGGQGNDFLDSNDTLNGGNGNDLLNGEAGNDILIGVNSSAGLPGAGNEIDTLTGGTGADEFHLGDSASIYYDDRSSLTAGLNNYALLTDFNPSEGDLIQLHGFKTDYRLDISPTGLPTGIAIYKLAPASTVTAFQDELIGIVQNNTNLSLDASYFSFV